MSGKPKRLAPILIIYLFIYLFIYSIFNYTDHQNNIIDIKVVIKN